MTVLPKAPLHLSSPAVVMGHCVQVTLEPGVPVCVPQRSTARRARAAQRPMPPPAVSRGLWLSPAKWRSPQLLLCWKIDTLMVVEQGHLVDAQWALVMASLRLLRFSCGKDIICSHRLKCWMPCLEMPSGALTFSDALGLPRTLHHRGLLSHQTPQDLPHKPSLL